MVITPKGTKKGWFVSVNQPSSAILPLLLSYIASAPIGAQTSMNKTATGLSKLSSLARKFYFSHSFRNIFKGNTTIPHTIYILRRNASEIHRARTRLILYKLSQSVIQNILFHLISVCPHQTMIHTFHSSFPESPFLILMGTTGTEPPGTREPPGRVPVSSHAINHAFTDSCQSLQLTQ